MLPGPSCRTHPLNCAFLFVCVSFFPDATQSLYAHTLALSSPFEGPRIFNPLPCPQKQSLAFYRLGLSCKICRLGVSQPAIPPLDTDDYNTSFRYIFGHLRQERLLDTLSELISQVHTHGFKPIFIEPLVKDGGVFVHFEYTPSQSEDVLSNIQSDLRSHVQSQGGVPSSAGLRRGNIWIVQGQPWREVPFLSSFNLAGSQILFQDMNRFASPIIRVAFDGADPQEETLYHTFRVFCLSTRNNTPLIPTTSHMVA
jgi:hypothetical protein